MSFFFDRAGLMIIFFYVNFVFFFSIKLRVDYLSILKFRLLETWNSQTTYLILTIIFSFLLQICVTLSF